MRMYKSLPTGHPGGMKIMKITNIYTRVVSCAVQTNYYDPQFRVVLKGILKTVKLHKHVCKPTTCKVQK